MSQDPRQDHVSKRSVVYSIAGAEAVVVRRDQEYHATEAGPLVMDLYYPPDSKSSAEAPAVVFVTGFGDAGAERMFGCKQKEMGAYVSWARLAAVSGVVAITYTNLEPVADIQAVVQHLRRDASRLGIDHGRIGVWSCSGNVPTALSALMRAASGQLRCAVLCCGYTLDLDGSTWVTDAARRFGFANPCTGKGLDDMPHDLPIFVARAGRDQMPGLNQALDRFVVEALRRNLPLTLVNHAAGPHAFDLFDDSETSREVIRRMLAFLQFHLLA